MFEYEFDPQANAYHCHKIFLLLFEFFFMFPSRRFLLWDHHLTREVEEREKKTWKISFNRFFCGRKPIYFKIILINRIVRSAYKTIYSNFLIQWPRPIDTKMLMILINDLIVGFRVVNQPMDDFLSAWKVLITVRIRLCSLTAYHFSCSYNLSALLLLVVSLSRCVRARSST